MVVATPSVALTTEAGMLLGGNENDNRRRAVLLSRGICDIFMFARIPFRPVVEAFLAGFGVFGKTRDGPTIPPTPSTPTGWVRSKQLLAFLFTTG